MTEESEKMKEPMKGSLPALLIAVGGVIGELCVLAAVLIGGAAEGVLLIAAVLAGIGCPITGLILTALEYLRERKKDRTAPINRA